MVKDVFDAKIIEKLSGTMGLGHVRYPTAGTLSAQEAQPFFVNAPFGIYLVHNGNLTHPETLKTNIQNKYHRHLKTQSDSELLINALADHLHEQIKNHPHQTNQNHVFAATKKLMNQIQGAYSVICLIDGVGLLAFRDPHGIRPLSYGWRSNKQSKEWIVASEDVAFHPGGFAKIADLHAGQIILIRPDGSQIVEQGPQKTHAPCLFEYNLPRATRFYVRQHFSLQNSTTTRTQIS